MYVYMYVCKLDCARPNPDTEGVLWVQEMILGQRAPNGGILGASSCNVIVISLCWNSGPNRTKYSWIAVWVQEMFYFCFWSNPRENLGGIYCFFCVFLQKTELDQTLKGCWWVQMMALVMISWGTPSGIWRGGGGGGGDIFIHVWVCDFCHLNQVDQTFRDYCMCPGESLLFFLTRRGEEGILFFGLWMAISPINQAEIFHFDCLQLDWSLGVDLRRDKSGVTLYTFGGISGNKLTTQNLDTHGRWWWVHTLCWVTVFLLISGISTSAEQTSSMVVKIRYYTWIIQV